MKNMISVPKSASNVTIRNLQFDEISADGNHVAVTNNYFGNSSYFCVFVGGSHMVIRDNTFGKLIVGGTIREASGVNAAIKAWGATATQMTIESNKISNYQCAISITDVSNGSDPTAAIVISNNALCYDSVSPEARRSISRATPSTADGRNPRIGTQTIATASRSSPLIEHLHRLERDLQQFDLRHLDR